MTVPAPQEPSPPSSNYAMVFATWFWFIFKNFLGWLFILSAWPIGVALPGPGGIPIFLIGFALVTFPGKRRLTTRVMRGRRIDFSQPWWQGVSTAIGAVIAAIGMWWLSYRMIPWVSAFLNPPGRFFATWVLLALAVSLLAWFLMPLVNIAIRGVPMVRRKVRPYLRERGIRLLPPRRRKRRKPIAHTSAGHQPDDTPDESSDEDEILEIHPRHMNRVRNIGKFLLRWSKPVLGVGITALILVMMIRPIIHQWDQLYERVLDQGLRHILIPGAIFIAMFAIFLIVFRVTTWRALLSGLGHRLRFPVAMRIWSTSELARYIPGAIWQVVGRVYLLRAYGVSATVSSTSQLLELVLFLFANILVSVGCLLWYVSRVDPGAQFWLYFVMALLPLLALLLHPRVFYGSINRLLKRLGRPPLSTRVKGRTLLRLLAWNLLGLFWQAIAVYIVLDAVVGLSLSSLWIVAGAYSLAWCAGFLAVWAPGGLAVREVVFVAVMLLILPGQLTASEESAYLRGVLTLLSFCIRIWTVGGELVLAAIANTADYRGVIGDITPGNSTESST